MAKLYAPILESSIPAFYKEEDKIKITLPFVMNRAISPVQVKAMAVKMKNVQSTSVLFEGIVNISRAQLEDNDFNFTFLITDSNLISKLYPTNSYKFQIAYVDQNDNIGYYSNVGVGKYTTKPDVVIAELNSVDSNICPQLLTGVYSQYEKDTSEKVYSYSFEILDNLANLIYSTGEQLHNSSTDTEIYESQDIFEMPFELDNNKEYLIRYNVRTINNLKISSFDYKIKKASEISTTDVNLSVKAINNFEDGYIKLKIENAQQSKNLVGKILIYRTDSDTNLTKWIILKEIEYANEVVPAEQLYHDFTTVQGVKYQYSVQWINSVNQYTTQKYSEPVYSDFEDMFLYDGDRQLKIRFNPRVSSFKINKQEQKVETLGSQFPFFLKNGNVNYKEFPLSGLISYYMDDNELFIPYKFLLPPETETIKYLKTTDFTWFNMAAERNFKLEVLNWLTNGKPKLFRSPAEGNYIVQLMNVSLSPNDSLGRMLHTFSCNAYECMAFNQNNCQEQLKGLSTYQRDNIISEIIHRLQNPVAIDEYGQQYYLLAKNGKLSFAKIND